jgi:hypothetical protein
MLHFEARRKKDRGPSHGRARARLGLRWHGGELAWHGGTVDTRRGAAPQMVLGDACSLGIRDDLRTRAQRGEGPGHQGRGAT